MDGELFKNWFQTIFFPNTETLRSAIDSITKGEQNVPQAAKLFNILRQMLVDKINSEHQGTYGGKTALSVEDENPLVE